MKLLGHDRKLALAGLTPPVDKVFRLTRMDSVFPLFHTLDTALEELRH
jgi:anti-sigma B factor antagonist